jgi:CheY-like chemotaxis protein
VLYPLSYGGNGAMQRLSARNSGPRPYADGMERGYDARRRRPVSRLRAPRVLVCDDTEAVRHLIRVNLELEGYDVIEAHDGEEALSILSSITDAEDDPLPDVVTVDALMPRRDGWWTVGMIRTDPRLEHIPVVMVTASVQSHHRAQAEQAAVDGFIAKPFEPDELIALVGVLASGGRV